MTNTMNNEKNRSVAFYTLGCKVNQYDTEAVAQQFKEHGYEIVDFDTYADVYVVNTCTVTHLSDRKCRQILRKTKRLNPESFLVAMGCYAQAAGDKIKETVDEVDFTIGTNRRSEIVHIVEAQREGRAYENYVGNIMEVEEFEELKIGSMDERTRVYLKIQEGCNNYCTYCIIPYVRGKIRSRKLENVIEEARRLGDKGFKEIVLTGIHLASYGKDLEDTNLIDVIEKLHQIETIERIRLGSIEPVVVDEAFAHAVARLPKLCPHFHLSLQSGSDTVLKRMNRKYTLQEYRESVKKLREVWPDVAITTDIIAGFPGESEEEFEETKAFAHEMAFAQVHLFPYSQREGTVAAKMAGQIDPKVKEKRVKELKEITDKTQKAFAKKMIGKEVEILVETQEGNKYQGYTTNYLKVEFEAMNSLDLENKLCYVQVETIRENTLIGKYIKSN